jgi:flagellar hook-associated protein FlgK
MDIQSKEDLYKLNKVLNKISDERDAYIQEISTLINVEKQLKEEMLKLNNVIVKNNHDREIEKHELSRLNVLVIE